MNYDYFDNLQEQLKAEIAAYNNLIQTAYELKREYESVVESIRIKKETIYKLQQEIGDMKWVSIGVNPKR